jgi:hypothetical protein
LAPVQALVLELVQELAQAAELALALVLAQVAELALALVAAVAAEPVLVLAVESELVQALVAAVELVSAAVLVVVSEMVLHAGVDAVLDLAEAQDSAAVQAVYAHDHGYDYDHCHGYYHDRDHDQYGLKSMAQDMAHNGDDNEHNKYDQLVHNSEFHLRMPTL